MEEASTAIEEKAVSKMKTVESVIFMGKLAGGSRVRILYLYCMIRNRPIEYISNHEIWRQNELARILDAATGLFTTKVPYFTLVNIVDIIGYVDFLALLSQVFIKRSIVILR